ncbi:MAG: hypothetical protein J1F17_07425 [Oscillospiraceae bacterium]|nr:hypothetical protein [Oscillospiraceae bacterium]
MFNQVNVQHIKNYFKKPSVLILSVLTFVAVIIPYFAMIPLYNFFSDIISIAKLFSDDLSGWNTDLYDYSYTASFSLAGSIISSIFSIAVSSLPAVAWLIINLNSKNNNSQPPNAGFLILFILSIIGIVGASIIIIYSGFLFLLGFVVLGFAEIPDEAALSFIIILFALILFFIGVFSLIYNILGLKFYSGVRKSTKSINMVVTGKAFGVFSIIYSIIEFLSLVSAIALMVLLLDIITRNAQLYEISNLINAFSDNLIIVGIIILISLIISLISGIMQGNIAIGYYNMAKAVPVIPEPPVYMNYNNNQYNQGYGYPQQTPVNNANNFNYNGFQNTYPQQQYNQNYNSNPQPDFQQQNDKQVDIEQNPYQQ